MSSGSKRPWLENVCAFWWRVQSFLWSVVVAGVVISLVSSWLIAKQWDMHGTPIGWSIAHPIVLALGGALLLLQTVGAFWIHQRGSSPSLSSAALLLQQREQAVLQACGEIEKTQPGQFQSVATLLQRLQDRYAAQDVVDTLEYLKERGEVELLVPFGGTTKGSFRLTPRGKRALALLT